MTSTYADVYFKASIKDGAGNPTEPPEDVYAQLTSLIESGILKGDDGLTPYVGSNNNWWIGDIDTGVLARGTDGEDGYTPVKGMDYFTEEEIQQIQNEVSGGAIGDFKAVVDEETATFNANAENTLTGYNANAQEKFDTYNANADSKFETYNTNAETKFSGYNTNAEAKLSEYNKNDLDKTTSYNTNADSKFTKYNTNAEAKFSEYTNNADTKLAEYNQNDSDKTDLYNTNAESKLGAYDSNAQAKLDLYNQNDSEKTEAYNNNAQTKLAKYNANAAEKLTTYDTNAEQHTTDYNRNAEQKLEAYNSNHAAKVAEYNANAETKTAEFDSNAAALQTEVDRLRGECDNLEAENRKQEHRIDALMKLNKGQTYDILPEEGETASRTAPSGAKYVGIDMVGGKSVVWNQIFESKLSTSYGVKITSNSDGSMTLNGTSETSFVNIDLISSKNFTGHKYMIVLNIIDNPDNIELSYGHLNQTFASTPVATRGIHRVIYSQNTTRGRSRGFAGFSVGTVFNEVKVRVMEHDLTQMFGAGNEPSTVEEFEEMFPDDYYEYCEPTIISSQTDRVDVASADGTITQQITTGFPVLNSAGSVHDYIDLNEGKLHRRVGEFILTADADISFISYTEDTGIYLYQFMLAVNNTPDDMPNICNRFTYYAYNNRAVAWKTDGAIVSGQNGITRLATKMNMDELKTFLSANEVIIQCVLTEPVITDITIPTELTDWLEVEPGGTVTFRNADETKQLAVPNAVSWVRKLDEVN